MIELTGHKISLLPARKLQHGRYQFRLWDQRGWRGEQCGYSGEQTQDSPKALLSMAFVSSLTMAFRAARALAGAVIAKVVAGLLGVEFVMPRTVTLCAPVVRCRAIA